jgi:hypothetical protein
MMTGAIIKLMKRTYYLLMLLASLVLPACGGGDTDDPEPTPTPPTPVTAPKVVSTTPADQATGIAVGKVEVQITYDQNVIRSSNITPEISGATLSGTPSVNGKVLALTLNCPNYETKVSLTIPEGYIYVTGAKAAAYTLTFTTEKKSEEPIAKKGDIATQPLTNNSAAGKLYTYLYRQYGEKTLSSVMAEWNWNHNIADKIFKATGKYPAMNCYDFIHIFVPSGNGWIDYNDITPVTEWADAGGIVSLMWHFNVPKKENETITTNGGGVTYSPSETTFKASNALKDGTWENKWFYQEMEKVANVILKLQDKGIAAVWRPFHEAAGNATAKQQANWTKSWFWWGYEGADTYKKLWKAMYDYFQQKGITNLLWVWTTQNYNGNSSQFNQDTDWYPGDNYVDIVARDLYGYTSSQNQQEFTEIQAAYPTKMVVLGECGTDTNNKKAFANIADVWSAGAKWGWFMAWCGDNLPSNDWWKAALSDSNVITRDQVKY